MNRGKLYWIFSIIGSLVLLFIIAPIAGTFIHSSPSGLLNTVQDNEVMQSIGLTLIIAFFTTLLFSILAVPFAYLLARNNFYFKKLVLAVINIPIIIPHTAAGIALLGVINRNTIFGKFAGKIGLDFMGQPAGIALAMAFVSLPFLINAAYDGFRNVPVRIEKAGLNLGASHFRVFISISIPNAWKNILSGMIMMFSRGISEFGAVVIIAYYPMITPVLIYERFNMYGLRDATPIAAVFILVVLSFFILLRILSDSGSRKLQK